MALIEHGRWVEYFKNRLQALGRKVAKTAAASRYHADQPLAAKGHAHAHAGSDRLAGILLGGR